MTTYKEIFGKYVKNYSSDPSSDAEGQVWYNTTSGTFKSVLASGTWSSGSPMITARRHMGDGGNQTAALAAGGLTTVYVATVEEYNGSGWSTGGSLTTARGILAGFGTQTAGVGAGGYKGGSPNTTAATEEYDGSTWSPGGNMSTSRYGLTGCGTQIAGLAIGGATYPPPTSLTSVEEYDGTNWTAGGSLPAATRGAGSAGTQTVALAFGGTINPNTQVSTTLEYDGSAWTAGGNLGTARYDIVGAGTQTSAIAFGGQLPPGSARSSATELYNGSTWASTGNMGTAREALGSANFAPQSAALAFGGYTGSNVDLTEEFNISSSIITGAAWASGGNLSTPRSRHTGFGSQTAAVAAANNPSPRVITEEYNGSAWGSGGNMNTGRQELAGLGTLTAGLAFGGEIGPNTQATEEYDGTSWTNGGNLTSPAGIQAGPSAAGTQTAGLQGGGATTTPAPVGVINWSGEYNGSSWATGNNINTARSAGLGGTQTAGVLAGGGAFPAPIPGFVTENYDGTTWTNSNSQLSPGNAFNIAGPVTNSVWIGIGPNPTTSVHFYDGTAFTTGASYATARSASAGAGDTATAGLIFGGNPGAQIASTEEYNPETTAANVKTITTS